MVIKKNLPLFIVLSAVIAVVFSLMYTGLMKKAAVNDNLTENTPTVVIQNKPDNLSDLQKIDDTQTGNETITDTSVIAPISEPIEEESAQTLQLLTRTVCKRQIV